MMKEVEMELPPFSEGDLVPLEPRPLVDIRAVNYVRERDGETLMWGYRLEVKRQGEEGWQTIEVVTEEPKKEAAPEWWEVCCG